MFPVVEKFVSINGEGTKAGELAVFIRFRKCNLSCSYCDTKWANGDLSPATEMTAEEIAAYVKSTGVKNVTLTGGEPLLQKDIAKLIELLFDNGNEIEIETNGSISIKELSKMEKRPSFTLDYKLPSSLMEDKMLTENYEYLSSCDTVKLVAGSNEDLNRALEIITKFSLLDKCHVYLSPVFGKINPSDMVDFMKAHNLNGVRLQLQLHKFIWDPNKKGV